MKTKLFIYLFPLIMIAGGSCANKKALVRDQLTVQYAGGNQEKVWKGVEAMKKISLKSLNVLVMDGTDIQMESPFKEPVLIYSDDSISIDSLIESRYYNHLFFNSFKESLPRKAKIQMLTEKLSAKALDSLIRVNKFDLVITAQQIRFNYQFKFAGMGDFDKFVKSHPQGVQSGSTTFIRHSGITSQPRRHAGNSNALTMGEAFELSDVRRMPPLLMRAVIYQTRWNLQWIDPTLNKNDTIPRQLTQEGFLTDGLDYAEILFSATAKQAGKNLAQVFKW
ncbi:hypothetical protein SDC9_90893 [bioreactor metagenome]|uniref:Lipoprotein n=1 Tax=bioreactor metagenome TaxID=1076179 RepID=A0A644ZTK0_9ZZZZ